MTKVSKKSSTKLVRFSVAENDVRELPYSPLSNADWLAFTESDSKIDSGIVFGFFVGVKPLAFADYASMVKEANPKANKPTRRSHYAIFQFLTKAGKVQAAIDAGFKPLEAWNTEAQKGKRARQPNLHGLFTLAKKGGFLKGEKAELTAEEKCEKQLLAAYKTMQECKGKKWQSASTKLLATLTGLGIQIPVESDDSDESEE